MYWKLMIQNARVFLLNHDLVSSVAELPGYYNFCKRVMFHIRDSGYAAALPLVESDRDLFVSRGFSGVVLRDLARLQGIRIQP